MLRSIITILGGREESRTDVMVRKFGEELKRRCVADELDGDLLKDIAETVTQDPEAPGLDDADMERCTRGVEALSPAERACLRRYKQGMSHAAIAKEFCTDVPTVRQALIRIYAQLAQQIFHGAEIVPAGEYSPTAEETEKSPA